jgi:hypothetical protein
MLFSRREKAPLFDRVLSWFWPRRGWKRAWGYVLRRVSRLSGSPHAVALGFAVGVFASFTPFMGFHFMIGFLLAYMLRGSLIASAFGTFVGNPLTFPFIWILTYRVGLFLLGMDVPEKITIELPATAWWLLFEDPNLLWQQFWNQLWPLIRPMTVGGVPIGTVIGLLFYFPLRMAVSAYQNKRRERLAEAARTQRAGSNDRRVNA